MRNGKLLGLSFMGGALSGLGQTASQVGQTVAGVGATTTISAGDAGRAAIGGGASTAGGKLADYYIQRAEQYHPIIPIGAGNRVEVVFQKGFKAEFIEDIAADMVMTYINGLLDVAETAASGTLNTEDENTRFRENLMSVRSQLGQRVSRIQVQQNGVMELEQNLSYMRQQLSSGLSDKVMSNYEFGGSDGA